MSKQNTTKNTNKGSIHDAIPGRWAVMTEAEFNKIKEKPSTKPTKKK